MIHGSEDRRTPLRQAQGFYAGLYERGVTAEIAVYSREGHGLRERAHRMDAWERTLAWLDRYLRSAG
jgi:dipeptidyl aminopeptidase/acylaminoacyl peptidase